MSTGDIAGNIANLQRLLKHVKYAGPVDEVGLRLGDPLAVLPLLHHVLLKYSKLVVKYIHSSGIELQGKTDQRFVEHAFKLFRDVMGLKPVITPPQFLESGFAERKVLLLCDVISEVRRVHAQLARQEKLAAAKAYRQTPKLFNDYWDTGEVRIERKPHTEVVDIVRKHPTTATDAAQDVYTTEARLLPDVGLPQHSQGDQYLHAAGGLGADQPGAGWQEEAEWLEGEAGTGGQPAGDPDSLPALSWLLSPGRPMGLQLPASPQRLHVYHAGAAAAGAAAHPAAGGQLVAGEEDPLSPQARSEVAAMARALSPQPQPAGLVVRGTGVSPPRARLATQQGSLSAATWLAPGADGGAARPTTPGLPPPAPPAQHPAPQQEAQLPASTAPAPGVATSQADASYERFLAQRLDRGGAAAAAPAPARQQQEQQHLQPRGPPSPGLHGAVLASGGVGEQDVLVLLVSLQARLAALEGQSQQAGTDQQQAVESLQGRVTVLEGRVKFLENELAAARQQPPQQQQQQQPRAGLAGGPNMGGLAAGAGDRSSASWLALAAGSPAKPSPRQAGLSPGLVRGGAAPPHSPAAAAWQTQPRAGGGSSWRGGEDGGLDGPVAGMDGVRGAMGAARAAARSADAAIARSAAALSPQPWLGHSMGGGGGGLVGSAAAHGSAATAATLAGASSTQELIASLAARYTQAQQLLQDFRERPAYVGAGGL